MTVQVKIVDNDEDGKLNLETAFSPSGVGAKRCAVGFNPAQDQNAGTLKVLSAVTMELLDMMKGRSTDPDYQRCLATAQTHLETACMYGVKAQFMD